MLNIFKKKKEPEPVQRNVQQTNPQEERRFSMADFKEMQRLQQANMRAAKPDYSALSDIKQAFGIIREARETFSELDEEEQQRFNEYLKGRDPEDESFNWGEFLKSVLGGAAQAAQQQNPQYPPEVIGLEGQTPASPQQLQEKALSSSKKSLIPDIALEKAADALVNHILETPQVSGYLETFRKLDPVTQTNFFEKVRVRLNEERRSKNN